jgi:aryl-alcohol dehydrogenase-like predicted oxidoreductase
LRTIRRALDFGINLLDTSDAYGAGENEVLVGEAVAGSRSRAFITTKFGWVLDESGKPLRLDASSAHVRRSCEASLKRLGTDYIDLYVAHRIDPSVPIEETVGELSRLVDEGKVRAIGLSEAGPTTLERAHTTAPVAALQTEYSLWSREPEAALLPLCGRLGIAFIAYSPLGRGFLAGQVKAESDLAPGDFRRTTPRFQAANLKRNLAFLDSLSDLAKRLGRTPAQLALAWLLSRPGNVYAIPGTRRIAHLRENLEALNLRLAAADLAAIGRAVPPDLVQGERHPAEHMKTIGR